MFIKNYLGRVLLHINTVLVGGWNFVIYDYGCKMTNV